MTPEITVTQLAIINLYKETRDWVATRPKHELEETKHRADECRRNPKLDWSVRTAAEIVFAATTITLENNETTKQPTTGS
jgi:hypothetical protein